MSLVAGPWLERMTRKRIVAFFAGEVFTTTLHLYRDDVQRGAIMGTTCLSVDLDSVDFRSHSHTGPGPTYTKGGTEYTLAKLPSSVRTNIEIDDRLMRQAMRSSGARTKKATVEAGLRLLVQTARQGEVRRLRGAVRWRGDVDESRRSRIS